jgi:hypothetical protein
VGQDVILRVVDNRAVAPIANRRAG